MKHIGITGGMGSGKSIVCQLFALQGVPVFNADAEAKQLYTTDAELAEWVRHRFGNETYVQHQFQPKVLAAKVFGNPEALGELNAQVHPRVRTRAAQWRAQQQTPYTLTEAALMMESGSYIDYNAVILVESPLELRLQRILQRDGITEAVAMQRIHAQWSDEQRRALATHIIHNNEQEALIPQVLALHRLWWR
jgi:dephospho-CoA kinase